MNKQEAAQLVALATANFPSMQDKDMAPTAQLWLTMLADLPYKLAERALVKVLMTARFFPTIADIREAARGLVEQSTKLPEPDEAWAEVMQKVTRYSTPEWSCPEIQQAVRVVGYNAICDSENIGVERAHFFKVYEAIRKRKDEVQLNETVLKLTGQVLDRVKLIQ